MRDHQHRAILPEGLHGATDLGFTFGINLAGGFIKNQDGWITENGPGNGQSLTLATGKRRSAFGHRRLQTIRQCVHKVSFSNLDGSVDFIDRSPATKINILRNGAPKHHGILGDHGHLLPQRGHLNTIDVHSVDLHHPLLGSHQTGEQTDQGGFAATIGTNDGNRLTKWNAEGNTSKRWNLSIWIGQRDVGEFD